MCGKEGNGRFTLQLEEDDEKDAKENDFDDNEYEFAHYYVILFEIKEGKRGSAGQYGCTLVHSRSPASVVPYPLSGGLNGN